MPPADDEPTAQSGDVGDDSANPIYDYLEDWPYVPQYLQASLDSNLIESHGEAVLRRALNTGRIVCFVGSGISMAYGRIGWGDLVRRLLARARQQPATSALQRRVRSTVDALDLDGSGGGSSSARYPALFQFLEQLRADSTPTAEDENPLRLHARQLLFDDGGHARLLFEDLIDDLRLIDDPRTGARRKRDGASNDDLNPIPLLNKEDLTRHQGALEAGVIPPEWSRFFDLAPVDFLHWSKKIDDASAKKGGSNPAQDHGRRLVEMAAKYVNADASAGARAKPLLPLYRFVVPALLRLTANSAQLKCLVAAIARASRATQPNSAAQDATAEVAKAAAAEAAAADAAKVEATEALFGRDLKSRAHAVRSETIQPARDPLALLAGGLGIGRFITTNYDLDIERLLRDRGFAPARRHVRNADGRAATPPAASQIADALGAEAHDSVFGADRALELVDFSVHNPDHAFNLIHLHGRATQGDDMIVTERDYLQRYLRKGDEADLVNIAISLAFSANPILFVGSGMNEDDILRPLRQFVAERRSRTDRKAVVLLPALGARSRQIEDAIGHYSRFGVFTVHYGFAQLEECPAVDLDSASPRTRPYRWLALMLEMCAALKKVVDALIKSLSEDSAKAPESLHAVLRPLQAMPRPTPPGEGSTPGDRPEPNWLDLVAWPAVGEPISKLREVESIDGLNLADAPDLAPKLECALLGTTLALVVDAVHALTTVDLVGCWHADHNRQALAAEASPNDRLDWLRPLLSARTILGELPSALIGLCLCAKLEQVRREWIGWKQRSEELPVPRPNGGPRGLMPDRRMRVFARHPIALRSRPGDPVLPPTPPLPDGDRFLENSPSRTFSTLTEALKQACLANPHDWIPLLARRRVFVLLATRGVGRGHFFETLRMPDRITELHAASWLAGKQPPYAVHATFNLSFSHEVVSAFDRLANLLVERAHDVFPQPSAGFGPAELIWNANARLSKNRVGRLGEMLRLYAVHAPQARARVSIAFNSFNFLFDERGFPKNAQLHRLVMSLFEERSSQAPIDFFLVCTESGFPRLFTNHEMLPALKSPIKETWSSAKLPPMHSLFHHGIGEKGQRHLDSIVARLNVRLASTEGKDRRDGGTFFHVLRGARASTTIAKYFPEVALAILSAPGCLHERQAKPPAPLSVPGLYRFDRLQRIVFDAARSRGDGASPTDWIPASMAKLAQSAENGRAGWRNLKALFNPRATSDMSSKSDTDFKHLFRELDRNRFLLTIICAAAAEAAWVDDKDLALEQGWRQLNVARITGWLASVLARHLSDAPIRRDDAFIATVFEFYQERHEAQSVLPERCNVQKTFNRGITAAKNAFESEFPERTNKIVRAATRQMRGPFGWVVQEHVLWHLAVVGHPVEIDVLAEAPKIRYACMQIVIRAACEVNGIPEAKQRKLPRFSPLRRQLTRLVLTVAMDLLVHRGLIFRLQPLSLSGAEATIGDSEEIDLAGLLRHRSERAQIDQEEVEAGHATDSTPLWRFALHRFVQRAIFRRLHSPTIEYPHVDQFSLSMWVTQPDELPRPNETAARDIADLTAEWTGYPQSIAKIDRRSAYHHALVEAFGTRKPIRPADEATQSLPARMLRAAFGVIRSVYSVGVVSRFHDTHRGTPAQAPDDGYFEQHRQQIRWILQNAVELGRKARNAEIPVASTAESPFFAEEIVWLYNECGLLCLVEGRLDAAAGLFRRALRAARSIESPSEKGALWSRIHLNMAMVDIERGQIRAAKTYLIAIRDTADENPILRLLAHGFIGLTENLAGDLDLAERIYKDVILDLEAYGQSRAIAIFSRQLGELYRLLGPTKHDLASAAIDRAVARATQGGHEDIRQLAKLSRVRLQMDKANADESGGIQRDLDAIERYGQRMGMPRLIASVAYARSTHLLSLGETHHASTLAASSLQIATANDLRLRQVTALSLLAKTCDRRGMGSAIAPLVARADELAESCEYTTARVSAFRHMPSRR